ncbi:MAG: molecular chaperone DnaJ [Candidatus Puniceispirillaceae bacterium]
MSKRDYYEVLGVSQDVDEKDLKSAYRKLAMKNHPDRNPDDEAAAERFREATEAYDVLKDPQKRAAYDRMGHAAFDQSAGGFGGGGFGGGGFGGGGFSDIFDQMFSEFSRGARGGQADRAGNDLRYDLNVSLEEAFSGVQRDINVNVPVGCDDCDGSGASEGSQPRSCGTCGGSGRVRAQQGFFAVERTCHTCHGMGQVIADPCRSCGGEGRVQQNKVLSVSVPAGVDTGTRIRLSGKGEAGLRGGQPGDLYIFISVDPHPILDRDGADIMTRIPVPMTTASLGGAIEVPTVEGRLARLTIEPGTQSGRRFRMRGKGMPVLRRNTRGDQIVEVQVETPTNLTKKQKDLLSQFADAGDTSPETDSFLKRVRRIWADDA